MTYTQVIRKSIVGVKSKPVDPRIVALAQECLDEMDAELREHANNSPILSTLRPRGSGGA